MSNSRPSAAGATPATSWRCRSREATSLSAAAWKRFAKVSGEMVSLTAVEDALASAFPQYGMRCQIAIVTKPDEGKGEMLIAVTNEPRLKIDEIRAAIKAKGL